MQEPALQNHMTREPAGTQEQPSDGADQAWRKAPTDTRGPVALRFAESRGEQNAISFQLFSVVSSSGGCDGLCRQQAGFNRRPNSLTALGVREPGRVPNEQNAVADNLPGCLPI